MRKVTKTAVYRISETCGCDPGETIEDVREVQAGPYTGFLPDSSPTPNINHHTAPIGHPRHEQVS